MPALHQGEAVLWISALGRWGGNKRLNYAGNTSLVFDFAFFSFSCLQLALVWKYSMEDSRRTKQFPNFKCAFLGWMMKSHPGLLRQHIHLCLAFPTLCLSICHLVLVIKLSPWSDSACVKTVAPECMGSAADSSRALRQARSVPFEGK